MRFGNKNTGRMWQKKFINKVFENKTNSEKTFSKIIMEKPELIEEKNSYIPKSLFKFYAPTSSNINDIKKKRLWLSHPNSFNDPFDCHTGYDVSSYEKHSILEHIKKIGFVEQKKRKYGFTIDDYNKILKSTTEPYFGWGNDIEEYWWVMHKLSDSKSKKFKRDIFNLTQKYRREVRKKVNKLRDTNIRVACFSNLTINKVYPKRNSFENMIQMWSHYADNHKGFCVEYDISQIHPTKLLPLKHNIFYKNQDEYLAERTILLTIAGLFPVIYTANRVNIPRTKLKKIKIDSDNNLKHDSDIDALLYKTYIVKSSKWSYENEWRIIIDGKICSYFDNRIPFPYIKKIFLGCKIENNLIDELLEIADELNVEVIFMNMDDKRFSLEPQSGDFYKLEKERSKWHNPMIF